MVLQTANKALNAASGAHNAHDVQGLSAAQAALALQENGHNELPGAAHRSLLAIARETLSDPMFALLLAAGVLYLALGDLQEGLIMFGLVLVVLALTLYQEGKTERAIESLRDLTSPRALVWRDGAALRIAGREVVVGDVLVLSEGDRVPADAVLIKSSEVQVDESLLTGEPLPVDKVAAGSATPQPQGAGARAERAGDPPVDDGSQSRLFSGTLLVRGHALARVTATGKQSEIGRIGLALGGLSTEVSPLKQQMARLVKLLAMVAVGASLFLLLAYGLLRGDWLGALLAAIALAMALLPQEFSVVLTVIPALGALALVLAATVWGASQLTEGVARAFAFATLVCTNLALIFSNRSRAGALWASLWVPNRSLWIVMITALGLMLLALYVPWLARLFVFESLPIVYLTAAAGLGLASVLWFELMKLRKGKVAP